MFCCAELHATVYFSTRLLMSMWLFTPLGVCDCGTRDIVDTCLGPAFQSVGPGPRQGTALSRGGTVLFLLRSHF